MTYGRPAVKKWIERLAGRSEGPTEKMSAFKSVAEESRLRFGVEVECAWPRSREAF